MHRPVKTVFSNMCMIYDDNGNVLILDRVDTNWSGIVFPGGHVESGESFTDSVIREVFEETGLTIKHPKLCGIKSWPVNNCRHVALLYKTSNFSGELVPSDEGKVFWMKKNEILASNIASGFDKMLQVFLDEDVSELYFYKKNDVWFDVLK